MTTRDQRLRELIREYRELRGLSRRDVAARLGVALTTYRRLECGGHRMNRLEEICRVLKISPHTLLLEAGFNAVKEEKK